jgi:hypothetical protein
VSYDFVGFPQILLAFPPPSLSPSTRDPAGSIMGRTARELKARVAAAAAMLQDEVGKPSHSLLSGFQADAVIMVIREADKMPADQLASIGTLIATAPFTQADISRMLTELRGGCEPQQKKRRSCQDYRSMPHFGNAALWEKLQGPATNSLKLEALVQLGLNLGHPLACNTCTCLSIRSGATLRFVSTCLNSGHMAANIISAATCPLTSFCCYCV